MESIKHNLEQLRMIKEQKSSLVEDQYTIKILRENVQKDALESQDELKKNVDLCFEIKDNIDKFDSIIEMKENLKASLIEKMKKKEEQLNQNDKEKEDDKMIEKDESKKIEKEEENIIEKDDVKKIEKEEENIIEKKEDENMEDKIIEKKEDENEEEKIIEKKEEEKDNKIVNEEEKEQSDEEKDLLLIEKLDDEIINLKIERNKILEKFNCYFEKNRNIREKINLLEGKIKKIMDYEVRLEERLRYIDLGIIELEDSIRRDQIQFYQSIKYTIKFETCKRKEIKEKFNNLIEENSCRICLIPFNDEDNVSIFTCNKHYYHEQCLKDWMNYQIICPICREIYSNKEENN